MRIFFTALALTALSFFAGIVGDLSVAPASAGPSVTLRLPPPIPADAPRARPLAPLATSTALADPPRRAHALAPVESWRDQPKSLPLDGTASFAPKREEAELIKTKAHLNALPAPKWA